MYSLADQLAADHLRDLASDYRIVVLHPNYAQQHICFSTLTGDEGSLYIRLDGKNLTRRQLEEQLDAALEAQTNQSGLGNIKQVVLDECDRALPEDFEAFVVDLLNQIGSGRLVLATRVPPHALLENNDLREQTVFVPVEETLMLWDYAQRNTSEKKVLLEVRALGTGRVLRDGKSVENWDGLLPRSLFFYLVDKGMTTRNDIFETFWPTLSVREATNVFHVTKRKISEVLGVDLTVYWSGFYHISPEIELSYDVVRFSEMLQDSAVAPIDEASDLLQRANSLYRDDFLTSLDMPWVENRRRELRQSYGEALIALGKTKEQQGASDEALGLYLRAITTNPHREDVALSVMKLYHSLGMPADALKVYERLRDELQQRLGVDPANHLQELAGELQRAISQ
jgi:DNA-binding SARP family transcriptional activator